MAAPVQVSPIRTAAAEWKALARRLSAPGRSQMRVWSPDTGKFSSTAKLTGILPTRPAAPYIYTNGRATLIPFDFDTKLGSREQVAEDAALARSWMEQCGGAVIGDYNATNGGRHLWALLAHGTTVSFDELNHLVRLLSARLRTLDITPVTNMSEGCLTVPGSPCKDGGYRTLDGSIEAAIEACATRSDPALLPRLYVLLGAIKPSPAQLAAAAASHVEGNTADFTVGEDEDLTLAPKYLTYEPYPKAVESFAITGNFPPDRPWKTRSHARQAVITAAIWRGHSMATIAAQIAPDGPWHDGLGEAYRIDPKGRPRRYERLLARDFGRALDWLTATHLSGRRQQHKRKNTQGGQSGFLGPQQHRAWLANAIAWADAEYAGKRQRHTVHAAFQSLVVHHLFEGETINGTMVVGVGGRNLSLGTGLLSDTTMWKVLAEVRDKPGAPIMLTRQHQQKEADYYALTMQNIVAADPIHAERVRVEPVHTAWSAIGHHRRRIYELVAYFGLRAVEDVFAAAKVSASTGKAVLADLIALNLLKRAGEGIVERGSRTLDDIAAEHDTDDELTARVAIYRAEREVWHAWLEHRQEEITTSQHQAPHNADTHPREGNPTGDPVIEKAWLRAVMADGPPPLDEADIQLSRLERQASYAAEHEQAALQLLGEQLGARVLAVTHA